MTVSLFILKIYPLSNIFIVPYTFFHLAASFRIELGVTIKAWAPADMLYMSYVCCMLVLLNEKKILTDTHSHVQTVEC